MTCHEFEQNMLTHPLQTTISYYAMCLAASPKSLAYLTRNCLTADTQLQVGFADRSLGKRLPNKLTKAGRAIRSQLETLGVYRSNGREHFRGFITVPLASSDGQVTGIYGHRVDARSSGPVEQSIGSGIFNATALRQGEELIVTDKVLDAWTFYAAGHTNVICAVDTQLRIADCSQLRRVLLAATCIDCEAFTNCEIHRIQFPLGHTAHSYAIEHRHELDPLAKFIRSAAWQSGHSARGQTVSQSAETSAADPVLPPLAVEPRPEPVTVTADTVTPAPRQASPVPALVDEFDVESTDCGDHDHHREPSLADSWPGA